MTDSALEENTLVSPNGLFHLPREHVRPVQDIEEEV